MATMTHRIEIVNDRQSFACGASTDVLRAMECLGRKGIPVGCRGGGCGVCKVRVIEGAYRTDVMSRACVSREERADGYALACKLFAAGDLRLQVVGKMSRCFAGTAAGFHVYSMCDAAPQTNN